MSEGKLSIKRMILIILIAWILSLVSVLSVVYVVLPNIIRPSIIRQAWHEVTKFSGTFQGWQSEDTNSFYVSSDHWRFYWTVATGEPPPEDVEFRLFLTSNVTYYYDARSLVWLKFADFQPSRNLQNGIDWWGYKEGTQYIIGSGQFAFKVLGARLDWKITVEAYY